MPAVTIIMIDCSIKCNRKLGSETQSLHVTKKNNNGDGHISGEFFHLNII